MTGATIRCACHFMIEMNNLPRHSCMAGCAITLVMPVWEFLIVTCDTVIGCIEVFSRIMAGITDQDGVLS
jgi:hypothetical protein